MTPRVVVLGGGPAGDVAALRAAQLGADAVLIERAELGGTCLNWGCIPTKSLLAGADLLRRIRNASDFGISVPQPSIDFARMMQRKEEVVLKMRNGVAAACKRRKVRVVQEHGVVDGDAVVAGGERFPYDHLVVCVGTEPSGLPGIDMEHPRVVTSNGILRLERVPEHLLVIGGGVVGCEFASLFIALGSRVTVVEVLPQVLAGVDPRIVTQFRRLVEKEGIAFHTDRRVASIDYRDESVTAHLDDGTNIDSDLVLVSVGRRSQTRGIGLEDAGVVIDDHDYVQVDELLRTQNPSIWGAGDCIGGLQLAHLASAEAARAVENALGHNVMPIDRTVVPSCIYTHPEIAMVGLNTETAKAAGIEVRVGQARFLGNGKALGEGEPDGIAQLYADSASDRLIGATVMGVHAVELISEISVAMSDGLTMDDVGAVVHPHPTVSEVIMDAAEQGEGVAPYLS
ncbi:MAG TPA: dihydrolipoyl dehydrogenase [Candidatus Dormibacteraeota bacterium]|nr:dihydrolipoyl dehydrogenase [Candidatus Dormibacteraeota bacterium]